MRSEELVANEVLAFLQYQLDFMDEFSLIQICTSNFNEEEIRRAETLLYESLHMADRIPSRRRDEKGETSLQDIFKVLKETNPNDVPTFVVNDLRKLPPVTLNHVDVTRLQRDITTLRSSLVELQLKLEVSQATMSDLRTEVTDLRNTVCRSHEPANSDTTRYGALVASDQDRSSLPAVTRPGQTDEEGFVREVKKIKKKSACRNQCGTALTGPNMLLRPAIPSTQLYVSRLHHSTKAEEVMEYIRIKTKFSLRVEQLESRHKINFKSFVVRVPTHHLETFMKEVFWPQGVVYRRFRGTLHDTTPQRNTSPTQRQWKGRQVYTATGGIAIAHLVNYGSFGNESFNISHGGATNGAGHDMHGCIYGTNVYGGGGSGGDTGHTICL